MKLFGPLYERTLALARHPRAPWYLVGLSFIEAIFFPIMPEVMLVPMCVGKPRRAFWFSTLSLAGSMAGAVVGYYLGHYAFEAIKPLFAAIGMLHGIESGIAIVQAKMAESPWAVFSFLVLGGFMTFASTTAQSSTNDSGAITKLRSSVRSFTNACDPSAPRR